MEGSFALVRLTASAAATISAEGVQVWYSALWKRSRIICTHLYGAVVETVCALTMIKRKLHLAQEEYESLLAKKAALCADGEPKNIT